jgi:hypothetical protein
MVEVDIPALVAGYQDGASAKELAHQHGVSVWTVLARLRSAGVEIRPRRPEKRLNLSKPDHRVLVEIVDGLLLGDGSIDRKGSLRLEQARGRKGWLVEVQRILKAVDCSSRIVPIPPRVRMLGGREIESSGGALLYTPCYVELKKQRVRWYPKGEKRVPENIKMSPMVLAQWLAGDGTYDHSGRLRFCTDGFRRKDVDLLIRALGVVGIQATRAARPRPGQYHVNVDRLDEAVKVKAMIEDLVPACFRYKLSYVRPPIRKPGRKLTDEQVLEIRERAEQGESKAALAERFGVSDMAVGNIVRRRTYKDL